MRILLSLMLLAYFTSAANAQSDWELQRDKSEIKVWTKDYPNSGFKQFKAETVVNATLENVVAVFLDIENMGLWYDRVEKVELVEKISGMEGTYRIDFDLPWPVANRVSAVRATLSHDTNTNIVTVNTAYEPGIITNSDDLLVTDMHSEWILTPVEDGTVHIFHKGYMDPAGKLPTWIANSGVKDGPVNTLRALKQILPDYGEAVVDFLR